MADLYPGATVRNCLIGMMKVNFLKRLESSVYSFAITMERTVTKIEDLEQRLRDSRHTRPKPPKRFSRTSSPTPEEDDDEELAQAFQVGKARIRDGPSSDRRLAA